MNRNRTMMVVSALVLTADAGVARAHELLDDTFCGVNTPRDVAADPGNSAELVYLVDSGNNRIRIFGSLPHPGCEDFFGSAGTADGQFMNPFGVTVDSSGRIYVADLGNDRIQKFSDAYGAAAPHHLDTFPGFNNPHGLGIDGSDRIYVANTGADRIRIINPAGEVLSNFGIQGDDVGEFQQPYDVAVCPDDGLFPGRIYVVDRMRKRVLAFDAYPRLDFLFEFGRGGDGLGQFSSPSGIALDRYCNVYVADTGNDRIQIFQADGSFLEAFAGNTLGGPDGVVVQTVAGSSGLHVLVSNTVHNSLSVYQWIDFDVEDNDDEDLILDTDGDGLLDDWEIVGIDIDHDGTPELDLPTLGADWMHKDLFVEVDYMEFHKPRPADPNDPAGPDTLDLVVDAFANAPVDNPDLVQGITLHVELGEEIRHQKFTPTWDGFADVDGDGFVDLGFDLIKRNRFGTPAQRADSNAEQILLAKGLAYRYGLIIHQIAIDDDDDGLFDEDPTDGIDNDGDGGAECSDGLDNDGDGLIDCDDPDECGNNCDEDGSTSMGGIGETPGNDFILSLGGFGSVSGLHEDANGHAVGSVQAQSVGFMHELGHTLGLQHGGGNVDFLPVTFISANCKPHYLSIMSYTYAILGIPEAIEDFEDFDPEIGFFGRLDYSDQTLPSLVESALDENAGIGLGFVDHPMDFTMWSPDGGITALAGQVNGPLDWNGNGVIDPANVAVDINKLPISGCTDGAGNQLNGFNDWANLKYNMRGSANFADGVHPNSISEEYTAETAQFIEEFWSEFFLICECLDPVVSTDPGLCSAAVDCDVIVSCTNLLGDPVETLICEPAGPYAGPSSGGDCQPTTAVTATASSAGSLETTIECEITVEDKEPPVITCPADVTITCGESIDPAALGTAMAADNCDPAPAITFNDVVIPTTCPADPIQEVILRDWTATDACGNSSCCLQTITVLKKVFKLDIKPGSCPNSYNRVSHGVLPVGLLGTSDFDVTTVDLDTILLSRADCVGDAVAPHEGPPGPRTRITDVGTPFPGEPCDCHELEGDGIDDISLKFKTDDVVPTLELDTFSPGALVELVVSGELDDGCKFIATDCVRLVPPGTAAATAFIAANLSGAWIDVSPLDLTLDGGGFADFERSFPEGTVVILTAEPASPGGYPFVRWVVDGVPQPVGSVTIEVTITDDLTLQALYDLPCAGDLDGDEHVGASDLAQLLGSWGPCDDCDDCPADFNDDCAVSAADLAQVLGAWGMCP